MAARQDLGDDAGRGNARGEAGHACHFARADFIGRLTLPGFGSLPRAPGRFAHAASLTDLGLFSPTAPEPTMNGRDSSANRRAHGHQGMYRARVALLWAAGTAASRRRSGIPAGGVLRRAPPPHASLPP